MLCGVQRVFFPVDPISPMSKPSVKVGTLPPSRAPSTSTVDGHAASLARCMSRPTSSLLLCLAVQAAAFPSARPHVRPAPCLRTGHDRAPSGWTTERLENCALLRLRGGGAARAGARSVAAVPEETGLRGDYGTLALLLLLYTLQGIPMGLSAVVPFLLAEKKVGSLEQAVFSVVQYPFALKLLWAPLVDSVYSRWVGRRLSWILPVQPAIGVLMLYSSGRVEALLSSGRPDVKALAGIFLALYLLAATQERLQPCVVAQWRKLQSCVVAQWRRLQPCVVAQQRRLQPHVTGPSPPPHARRSAGHRRRRAGADGALAAQQGTRRHVQCHRTERRLPPGVRRHRYG